MSLSDTDTAMIKRIQDRQLSPRRKGLISFNCASEILAFIRVKPLVRESMSSLCDRTGLSKTKIYTIIRDYKEEGVTYESIPNGFEGVYQRRRYLANGTVDK